MTYLFVRACGCCRTEVAGMFGMSAYDDVLKRRKPDCRLH